MIDVLIERFGCNYCADYTVGLEKKKRRIGHGECLDNNMEGYYQL